MDKQERENDVSQWILCGMVKIHESEVVEEMTEQEKWKKVIKGLEICKEDSKLCFGECECGYQSYFPRCWITLVSDTLALLQAQEPRVMTLEEVIEQEPGTILWVEEAQSVVWNLFPLEIDVTSKHPDTGTHYLFFIAYHDIKKFECVEYNQVWRCWTSRPTDAQREATPWNG